MTYDDEFLFFSFTPEELDRAYKMLEKNTGITPEDFEELDSFRKFLGPHLSFADVANVLIESDRAIGPEVDAYLAATQEYDLVACLDQNPEIAHSESLWGLGKADLWRLGKARYHATLRMIAATIELPSEA